MRFHPSKTRATAHGQNKNATSRVKLSPDIVVELMTEYPWLTMQEIEELIGKNTCAAGTGGAKTVASTGGTGGHNDVVEELPEDLLALVQSELQDVREALGAEAPEESYFYTKVLGGEWAKKRCGHSASDIGSFARGSDVKLFCRSTGFPMSRTVIKWVCSGLVGWWVGEVLL